MLEITSVKYIGEYKLSLSFNDGTKGVVDLSDALWGPVFEPLKDINEFQRVKLSPDLHTVVWPNDADFAPEFLKEKLVR